MLRGSGTPRKSCHERVENWMTLLYLVYADDSDTPNLLYRTTRHCRIALKPLGEF
jgi:hypothetical protein